MNFVDAVALGLLQGLTEFLPVSSSGHLALARIIFGIDSTLTTDVLLHFASLFAIFWFFRKKILALDFNAWLKLLTATIPIAVVGLFFRNQLELLSNSWQFIVIGLFITSTFTISSQLVIANKCKPFLLPILSKYSKKMNYSLFFLQLLSVGFAQVFALAPGISRSGTTVSWGLLSGFSRKDAFSWSFLLAIPAIGGATIVEFIYLINNSELSSALNTSTLIAMFFAFIAGLISLFLLNYVLKKAQIWWFSLYTLMLAIAVTLKMTFF